MKKVYFLLSFFIFCCFLIFGDAGEQEEIDFLLFLPNSSSQFVDEEQASIQLDNLAKYIMGRDLVPGQISVYGYAAYVQNDIEPVSLSRDRAVFVISELQKRGISKELFSDPVAYGSVDLWGSNINEENRGPNRRVRIMLEGAFISPGAIQTVDPQPIPEEVYAGEPGSGFPWKYLLPLLLLPLIIFLASRGRKKDTGVIPEKAQSVASEVLTSNVVVDLDEEIRRRAFELYLQRNCENGDADGDWYMAVCDICPRYEADGYRLDLAGHWQATKTFVRSRQ